MSEQKSQALMKSAIEWFEELKVPFDGDITIQDIIRIQDDAMSAIRNAIAQKDEALRAARNTLAWRGWHKCGCPGHWKEHSASCSLGQAIAAIDKALEK